MAATLGERICTKRFEFGLSQAALARMLDVSRSSVNAWELGFATPQLKHVIAMAKIFSTSVDGLLNPSGDEAMINISDLNDEERRAIFNLVNCMKKAHEENK